MLSIGKAGAQALAQVSLRSVPNCGDALPAKPGVAAPPPLTDRRCDVDLPGLLWSSWTPAGAPRPLVRALSSEERAVLVARASALHEALAPAGDPDTDRVATALFTLFGGYRNLRQTGADAVALVDGAKGMLMRRFPAWAIERACDAIHGAEVAGTDPRWPPNDAEIARVCRDIVAAYAARLGRITRLLEAPVEPPAVPRASPEVEGPRLPPPDGRHGVRVKADLTARQAARSQAQAEA